MSLTSVFTRLHDAVSAAERILIVAHKKPDGDTLGSSSSVLNWLLREGKQVKAFCVDVPPISFRYLDGIHHYTNDPAVFDDTYHVVVVFDSGDLRYCGIDEHMSRLKPGYLLVNIDHHVTNAKYGHLNLVFTDASSTAEVIHRYYEANNIAVDGRMATSLLTGLLTDTSHFSNAATTAGSMEAAAKMVAAGARHQDITRHLLQNKSVEALKIWGKVLSRLQYNSHLDIATTYILLDDMKSVSDDLVEGISNFLNAMVEQTDAVLVLREMPSGGVKGSLRSLTRDISKFAKLLGGGGHKKAAGFTIKGRIEVKPEGIHVVSM